MSDLLNEPRYLVGQIVRVGDRRAVVVGSHASFSELHSEPAVGSVLDVPEEQRWYALLVEGTLSCVRVAESEIEISSDDRPVEHPQVFSYFDAYVRGHYVRERALN